jgi:DNA-binding SARP family transcriptional activator
MDVALQPVNIDLLGPMSVRVTGHPVTPTAAKQRKILALLALNAGRVVSTTTLSEELWGDAPPATGTAALHTYILGLRKRLSAGPRHLISTHHRGYLLQAAFCRTDVSELDRYVRPGRAAAESGDHRTASDLLTQALALWRGPALSDVPPGRILEVEATSLEETRLGILERRVEADLALNRHADILGELRLLTARHPMSENLSGFLMISLYRSGHVGRALTEYHRLRTVLRVELGIDPSPRLQQLHDAILTHSPSLDNDHQLHHPRIFADRSRLTSASSRRQQ